MNVEHLWDGGLLVKHFREPKTLLQCDQQRNIVHPLDNSVLGIGGGIHTALGYDMIHVFAIK